MCLFSQCSTCFKQHCDDEHFVARNMKRIIIIDLLHKLIVNQVGHLPRIIISFIIVIIINNDGDVRVRGGGIGGGGGRGSYV